MDDDDDTNVGYHASTLGQNETNNDGKLTIKLKFIQVTSSTRA